MASPILKVGAYESPRWSTEFLTCSMPVTFDQYGRCGWDCIYCFAAFQRSACQKKKFWSGDVVTSVDAQRAIKALKGTSERSYDKQFRDYLRTGKMFQWGGMSDPFCPYERKFGVGLEILEALAGEKRGICFNTKGTWWTRDAKYVDLFRGEKNWVCKVSITTLDERLRKIVEPMSPSSLERFKALKRISDFSVLPPILRMRPFIIGVTDPHHTEMIKMAADCGVKIINIEFLCVEQRCLYFRNRAATLSREIGFDLFKFYKKYSNSKGYMRLNWNIKQRFVEEAAEACDKYGCKLYMADNNCRGRIPMMIYGASSLMPCNQGQWVEAIRICVEEHRPATWGDIAKHVPWTKNFIWRLASGFNTGCTGKRARFFNFSFFEWMRFMWNHPQEARSPFKMFEGYLIPKDVDANGDIRYVIDTDHRKEKGNADVTGHGHGLGGLGGWGPRNVEVAPRRSCKTKK